MPNLIVYNSKKRAFVSILAYIGLLIPAVYFFLLAESTGVYVAIGALVVFMSLWVFIYARRFFDNTPQLVMNDEGIYAPAIGNIDWKNVKQAFVISDGDSDFVSIVLKDYKEYSRKAGEGIAAYPTFNAAAGFETIDVDLTDLEVKTATVARTILDLVKSDKLNIS